MIYVTPRSCQTHAGCFIKPAKIEFIYFSTDQHQHQHHDWTNRSDPVPPKGINLRVFQLNPVDNLYKYADALPVGHQRA